MTGPMVVIALVIFCILVLFWNWMTVAYRMLRASYEVSSKIWNEYCEEARKESCAEYGHTFSTTLEAVEVWKEFEKAFETAGIELTENMKKKCVADIQYCKRCDVLVTKEVEDTRKWLGSYLDSMIRGRELLKERRK